MEHLPEDVLRKCAGLMDQSSRVRCMIASKSLYARLHVSSIWTSVHFTDIDFRALDFLSFATNCERMSVTNASPDDVQWFLETAAATCPALAHTLVDLDITVAPHAACVVTRVPHGFAGVLTMFPALETASVRLPPLRDVCHVELPAAPLVPGGMSRLRALEWTEADDDANVHLDVSPAAGYAGALHTVKVRARTCDVLAKRFPGLRVLEYEATRETYDDVRALPDADFDVLDLHVHDVADGAALVAALGLARRLGQLRLTVTDDFSMCVPVAATDVVVRGDGYNVTIDVDFDNCARHFASLSVGGTEVTSWLCVRFLGMDLARLGAFADWSARSLRADPCVTVGLDQRFF
jgi:hypothetical protein